jgi:hypothetical protein
MFTLKYVPVPIPGKPLNQKNFSAQERKTNYEEHRPERKFDNDWQAKIPRLKIDDIKNSSNKFGFAGNIWACLSANITLHN